MIGVGVEGVPNPAGVSRAERPGEFAVGGDRPHGNLAGQGINLSEKIHRVIITKEDGLSGDSRKVLYNDDQI